VKRPVVLILVFAASCVSCGDAAHRPIPAGPRAPGLAAEGQPPVLLTAVAVEGHPPLPTYHVTLRNLSDRPVRRVLATVVYLDAEGRAIAGEDQDVAFGSPLKAIDPGVTLESTFLSRVERAPGVRLVVRSITFLEKGTIREPRTREWANPRYDADLAVLHGTSPGDPS